jgi:hypothetical protein
VTALLGFTRVAWEIFLKIIAPVAPHMAESHTPSRRILLSVNNWKLLRLDRIWANYQESRTVATGSDFGGKGPTFALAHDLNAFLQLSCGAFKATDPRDHLYALLGLLGQRRVPHELCPDYSLPIERVYHEYASFLLKHTKDLRILEFLRRDITGVPSWVPDWRFFRAKMGEHEPLKVGAPYLEFSEDTEKMKVEGVQLGRVAIVIHLTHLTTMAGDLADLPAWDGPRAEEQFGYYSSLSNNEEGMPAETGRIHALSLIR